MFSHPDQKEEKGPFILNILPDLPDIRDFKANMFLDTQTVLPESYTTLNQLLPIRNQGSQGTCAAFAATSMKEYQERIEHPSFHEYFSPQFVYNCRPNYPSAGMYSRDLMGILANIGVVTENNYPYGSNTNHLNPSATDLDQGTKNLLSLASNYKITAYTRISTIDDAKRALIANGPLHISFPAYNYTEQFWRKTGEMIGGHAVAIVAYDNNGFTIRNSWGTSYGKNGYGLFPYTDWELKYDCWSVIDGASKEIPTNNDNNKSCCVIF